LVAPHQSLITRYVIHLHLVVQMLF